MGASVFSLFENKERFRDPSTEGETSKKKQRERILSSYIYSLIYERLNSIVVKVGPHEHSKGCAMFCSTPGGWAGRLLPGTICGSPRLEVLALGLHGLVSNLSPPPPRFFISLT